MKLQLTTAAKLTHINTRIEKHGEDDALACDLKFELHAVAEEFLPQVCAGDWKVLRSALWEAHGDRKVLEPALEPIRFNTKFEDHSFKFCENMEDDVTEAKVTKATIKKIVVKPENGAVLSVELTVQLTPSPSQYVQYCNGLVAGGVQFSIDPPMFPVGQTEMKMDAGAKGAAAQ